MKILVICQYYYPEPFRITDICEELVHRGHEVRVVTGYPNYPEGILYEGYGWKKHIDEVLNGVHVHRCFTIPRGSGTLTRFLNYYSYVISSIAYVCSSKCKSIDGEHFDVVLCNQLSPVMMAHAAGIYKRKYKVRELLYCLDLWPESLIAGGISRKSLIYRFYRFISGRIYRQVDRILVSSLMFSDYLSANFGILQEKIEYLPQYAENIYDQISQKEYNSTFDLMFAGNIGKIQSVDTIIKAAKLLNDEHIKFHIVGDGTDLERIKKMADGLDNVIFYGRHPISDMPMLYAKADAMLVTLADDPIISMTLPGKIQSYLAAGKPIIGAANGETKRVIEEAECGLCGAAENAIQLADNIMTFIERDSIFFSLNASKYYKHHFNKDIFFEKIENDFQDFSKIFKQCKYLS